MPSSAGLKSLKLLARPAWAPAARAWCTPVRSLSSISSGMNQAKNVQQSPLLCCAWAAASSANTESFRALLSSPSSAAPAITVRHEPSQSASTSTEALLPSQKAIAQQLLRVLARRLRRTNASLADLIFTDVPGRVAKTLLQLANRFGVQEGGSLRVNHDLTQEEIAQLVGASRETVNKALATFAHRGWIRLEGKSVVIVDTEHLA